MNYDELVKIAVDSKEKSYSPYSGFRVGAAVIAGSGKVYTGVNIENSSFGATVCAERTAVFKAVSEGEKRIEAIAIASDSEKTVYPCGICRQVLCEFGREDMKVICSRSDKSYEVYSLEDLLPKAFKEF